METKISIINSPAASAGDLVVSGGMTKITGLDPIPTSGIISLQVKKNTQVQPQVWSFNVPVTTSAVVQFLVTQQVGNQQINAPFYYEFANPADGADCIAAIQGFFASFDALDVTVSTPSGSPITFTVTASTTNPFVQCVGIQGCTVTYAMPTITPHATPGTALAGTTTVTVTTTAGQNFRTGDIVTISGMTGYSITQNGVAGLTRVTTRITYATATTFTLDGCVGTGTNTTAITITKVAVADFGSPTYVDNQAALAGSTQTATVTTTMYSVCLIKAAYQDNILNQGVQRVIEAEVWIPANLIASAYTANTNGAALITALEAIAV